jgi:hypothetical protein
VEEEGSRGEREKGREGEREKGRKGEREKGRRGERKHREQRAAPILNLEMNPDSATKKVKSGLSKRGLSYSWQATKVALNIVSIFPRDGLTSRSGGCRTR